MFDKTLCLYILIYYIDKLSKFIITWKYVPLYLIIILYLLLIYIYMNEYFLYGITNRY